MPEFMEMDVANTLKVFDQPGISRRGLGVLAGASLLPLSLSACGSDADSETSAFPSKTVRIMVPAEQGGGWDTTARALSSVLTESGLIKQDVEVYNVTDEAGTYGLAEFVDKHQGDMHELMVTGLVMVGGIVANASPVTLSQTTIICTITGEQEMVVVPEGSKYKTLTDVMNAVVRDPASVVWGGGSAGGTDQILVGLLGKAVGADLEVLASQYIPSSGGGDSVAGILSGELDVAVASASEYAKYVESGEMVGLAVSGSTSMTFGDVTVPTVKEQDIDIEVQNWRGVVSPPGIPAKDVAAIRALFDRLHESEQWRATLDDNGWDDFYLSGDEADAFFDSEADRTTEVLSEIGLTGE